MKKKLVSLILVAAMLGTLIGCGSEPAGMDRPARRPGGKHGSCTGRIGPAAWKHLKTRTSGR